MTKHRYWGQGVFLHTSQCRRPGQVSQLQADEEGEVPTAPRCPLIPQLACLNFAYVIPPEEYLGLHGLSLHWPFIHSALAIQGFQQAVVHSRSLKETWLFFLYQNQLSEMMSLGKRMENLLSTSPVLLLLSFGGRYLRHPLIWYSWFFSGAQMHWLYPSFLFFTVQMHFDACIALKQSSHFFLLSSAWSFC